MERAEQLAVSVWAYFLFVLNVVGLFFIFSYIYIEYIIYTTFSCKNNGYWMEYPWINVGLPLTEGALVTGVDTELVTWTQHRRCVKYFHNASPMYRLKETCLVYARLLCLDKRIHVLSTHVDLLCVNERRHMLSTCVSSFSTRGDVCCEPASLMSRGKHQLLGPTNSIGNVLYTIRYIIGILVTGVPSEARYSLISFCNMVYLTRTRYWYVGHPYSNLPVCWLHPRSSQDLAATTTKRHHKHILITYIH
jgi:hypothetical protein